MPRFVRYLLLVIAVAALAGVAIVLSRSPDPYYAAQEWIYRPHFWEFDELIVNAGRRYSVDPKLVKAIVWRESRFNSGMVGGSGERGLMQVTDAAGRDWAKFEKLETFEPTDLFDPKTNLEAGTWYISRALERWKAKDDPIPFSLAEYNAGKRRVDRWIGEAKNGPVNAEAFLRVIDFPTTRHYIEEVSGRYRFYQQRKRL